MKWIKKKIQRSKKMGWLYIIRETWGDFKNRIEKAKQLREARQRGFCVWCSNMITSKQACYQVCEKCPVFEPNKFLHARCLVYEESCEKCKRILDLQKNRRVQ